MHSLSITRTPLTIMEQVVVIPVVVLSELTQARRCIPPLLTLWTKAEPEPRIRLPIIFDAWFDGGLGYQNSQR